MYVNIFVYNKYIYYRSKLLIFAYLCRNSFSVSNKISNFVNLLKINLLLTEKRVQIENFI